MSLGYDYFQGFFFCKSQLQRAKRIPKSQPRCRRFLQKVNEPNFDKDPIEELLTSYLKLSYKLLRYLNYHFSTDRNLSAQFGRPLSPWASSHCASGSVWLRLMSE